MKYFFRLLSVSIITFQLSANAYESKSYFLDNDGDAYLSALERLGEIRNPNVHFIANGMMKPYLPFETVVSHLSPYLESKFDLFIFVNTSEQGSDSEFIRPQHLRIFQRLRESAAVFPRNQNGTINFQTLYSTRYLRENNHKRAVIGWLPDSVNSNNDFRVYQEVPVSSGSIDVGIQTYSGIFRVNDAHSKQMFTTDPGAAMSFSVYIDHIYPSGRIAKVAIHGTPVDFEIFGRERSSHGCVRTHPEFAKQNYQRVLTPQLFSHDLPEFNKKDVLPKADLQNGIGITSSPGYKALIVLFDGYNTRAI